MVVVAGEAPRIVVGVETFVGDATAHFETGLIGHRISFLAISEDVAIHHANTHKSPCGKTLTQRERSRKFGTCIEMIKIDVSTREDILRVIHFS